MNGEITLCSFADSMTDFITLNSEITQTDRLEGSLENDRTTKFVYETLTLADRKTHGIFFSGEMWAKKMFSTLNVEKWKRFIDPSVGVGDLLIEICNRLPLNSSLDETLDEWSRRLIAIDLRESFLKISWMRIQALAISRHRRERGDDLKNSFKELPKSFLVGNLLSLNLPLQQFDCVVMNPPYQKIEAPIKSFVGKGKRSAAAIHLEHVLTQAPNGVGIYALIPDVLRCGSSYQKFRSELSKITKIESFEPHGAFGTHADVDVCILIGYKKKQDDQYKSKAFTKSKKISLGDLFDVSVGPVVPHRTSKSKCEYGYLTAKNAQEGIEISKPPEFASFACRTEKGPFVLVRRTSSPTDKRRARWTLIKTKQKFLVENHLLIIRPKDNTLATCRALIDLLKSEETNEWLNYHMRCRHLTVGALKSIPWFSR